MSTTVVASRHGLSLHLLPAAGPALDTQALGKVLARHGLDLIDGQDLLTAPEFIAAEGLGPAEASALADDLRAMGLRARVVNRTELTSSRRVGNALGAQMMAGMVGLILTMSAGIPVLDAIKDGVDAPGLAVIGCAAGVILMLTGAINAAMLQARGGLGLRVAGQQATASSPARQLTDELQALEELLPAHLAGPILERAHRLEAHARRDPHGQAAAELHSLVGELRAQADEQATMEAQELREEVRRARRALQETGGH